MRVLGSNQNCCKNIQKNQTSLLKVAKEGGSTNEKNINIKPQRSPHKVLQQMPQTTVENRPHIHRCVTPCVFISPNVSSHKEIAYLETFQNSPYISWCHIAQCVLCSVRCPCIFSSPGIRYRDIFFFIVYSQDFGVLCPKSCIWYRVIFWGKSRI